jgi:hypothetical protein
MSVCTWIFNKINRGKSFICWEYICPTCNSVWRYKFAREYIHCSSCGGITNAPHEVVINL